MKLHVIGTGSKANSYVLTMNSGWSVLLDAGVPCSKVQAAIGKDWPKLGGVLITHDHGDHARAVHEFLSLGIPVYSSRGTKKALHLPGITAKPPSVAFTISQPNDAGGPTNQSIYVMPFRVRHDDPDSQAYGYLIQDPKTGERFLYATDFSCSPEEVARYKVPGVHYWLIECNFCDDLVDPNDAIDRRRVVAHMGLDRLKGILRVNDMATARRIVICHLSDLRADESRMVREIKEQTGVETIAARNGLSINLGLTPF
jgi:phosphoribosyl 1,2-cyclic phosphodiesterase